MTLSTEDEFAICCDEANNVFTMKNAQYGNAIVETGVLGASVELIGCVARLKELVLRSGDGGASVDPKVLENIFIDAHNYANIGKMMLNKKNYTGVKNYA